MRMYELLSEAINIPYAFQVYEIIDICIQNSSTTDGLRHALEEEFSTYFRSKLSSMEDVARPHQLDFYVRQSPEGMGGVGGAMRHSGNNETDKGFAPLPDNTLEIYVFVNEEILNSMLDKTYNDHESSIKQFGSTALHEFVHVVQYIKANVFKPLATYTRGSARPTVDGVRYGKRGGYDTDNYKSGGGNMRYLSTDIEVEAFAVSGAAEIIHQSQKYDDSKAYIEKTMRSLRDMSRSLASYKDTFQRSSLNLFGNGGRGVDKRAKEKVWKTFKSKLARHLNDYLINL